MSGRTVVGCLLYEGDTVLATFHTHAGAYNAMVRLGCPTWTSLFPERTDNLAIEADMRRRRASLTERAANQTT